MFRQRLCMLILLVGALGAHEWFPDSLFAAEAAPDLEAGAPLATIEVEKPDNPPGAHPAREDRLARSPGLRIWLGSYQSTKSNFLADVFRSTDGGVTWLAPVTEYGGDKNWMTIDRSGGASDGFIYGIWQRFSACCGSNVLTRSANGGASFESPVPVAF